MRENLTLHRSRIANTERLTLLMPGASVVVELTVRGLDLDATTIERLLHAALGELVRERI